MQNEKSEHPGLFIAGNFTIEAETEKMMDYASANLTIINKPGDQK